MHEVWYSWISANTAKSNKVNNIDDDNNNA